MNKELNDISLRTKRTHATQCDEEGGLTLLFDFGGTLDTAGCHWGKFLWYAYKRNGIPVIEDQFREAYVNAERILAKQPIIQSHDTFLSMLTSKLKLEFEYLVGCGWLVADKVEAERMQRILLNDIYDKVKANIAESREVLSDLKKHYRIGLVTNFYGNMPVVLEEFGLSSYFETVTESAVVGVRKPDSQIFNIAVKSMDVKPENVIVIGDSYTKDILPAYGLGCRTVWLKGEGWTSEEPTMCVADYNIKNLVELQPILRQYTPL
nr:HAD family hydrolase [uncultured Prevotella sp.]